MNIVKIVKNVLRNLKFTMGNIPNESVTINYPEEKRDLPDRLRIGTFGLTQNEENGEENCIACKLCEKICQKTVPSIFANGNIM